MYPRYLNVHRRYLEAEFSHGTSRYISFKVPQGAINTSKYLKPPQCTSVLRYLDSRYLDKNCLFTEGTLILKVPSFWLYLEVPWCTWRYLEHLQVPRRCLQIEGTLKIEVPWGKIEVPWGNTWYLEVPWVKRKAPSATLRRSGSLAMYPDGPYHNVLRVFTEITLGFVASVDGMTL